MDIADLPHAVLRVVSVNEIGFDQKANPDGSPTLDDPTKVRIGAYPGDRAKFYIGAISMDVLRRDGQGLPHRTEVGLIKLAVDEMADRDGDPVPMIEIFLTPSIHDSTDAAMQRVLTLSRKGLIVHVPTSIGTQVPTQPSPVAGPPQQLWDGTGRYFAQMQNDGTDNHGRPIFNFVAYQASAPFSIANPEAVLFSSNDILARLAELERRVGTPAVRP